MLKLALPIALAATTLVACNGEDEVFEKIDKLRALGVAASPLAVTPTDQPQVVTLTFHAALPLGQTVTAEPFVDEGSKFAPSVAVTPVGGSEAYEAHAQLQLYRVSGTFNVPPKAELPEIPADPGFVRMRYGMRLKSAGEEEEIVGTYLVYAADAPQLAWNQDVTNFKGTITAPTAGETLGGKYDIKAEVTNPFDDVARIGWFVSAGKLRARRAKETQWDTDGKTGPETVVLTVRGMKSGIFAVQAVDVTVQ